MYTIYLNKIGQYNILTFYLRFSVISVCPFQFCLKKMKSKESCQKPMVPIN